MNWKNLPDVRGLKIPLALLGGSSWPLVCILVGALIFFQTQLNAQIPTLQDVVWSNFTNTSATYPTPGSGSTLMRSAGTTAWNADARSTRRIRGDGYVQFRFGQNNKAVMLGLEDTDSDNSYTSIDYVIYGKSTGLITVYESGTNRTLPTAPAGQTYNYTTANVFTIKRTGCTITYWKDNWNFYTSTVESIGALQVDDSFDQVGGSIQSCQYFGPEGVEDVEWEVPFGSASTPQYTTNEAGSKVTNPTTAGWAGMVGSKRLLGDGYVQFRFSVQNKTASMGLAIMESPLDVDGIAGVDYCIQESGSGIGIYENGVQKCGPISSAVTDIYRIQRFGDLISYYRNDQWIYTSSTRVASPSLIVHSLMESASAAIDSCQYGGVLSSEKVIWSVGPNVTAFYNSGSENLAKSSGDGAWNAGAVSAKVIPGDGFVRFLLNSGGKLAVGLSAIDPNGDPSKLEFGLETATGQTIQVVENGVPKGIAQSYNKTDIFTVRRAAGFIEYYQNGALMYQESCSETSSLYAAAAFYDTTNFSNCEYYGVPTDLGWRGRVGATESIPTPGAGSTLKKTTATTAWDTSALGTQVIAADGFVQFQAATSNKALFVGLTAPTDTSYDTLDYSFYLTATSGSMQVRVNNTSKMSGSYNVGDIFNIKRQGGTVTFWKNGILLYTSTIASSGDLFVSTAYYTQSGSISGCQVYHGIEDANGNNVADDWENKAFRGELDPNQGPDEADLENFLRGSLPQGYPDVTKVSVTTVVGSGILDAPANIHLSTTVSDPNGAVWYVNYYADGSYIGAGASSSPNSFTWTGVPYGKHSIYSVAIDSIGVVTQSAPIEVNVNSSYAPVIGGRFVRGTSLSLDYDSMVLPLDFEGGVGLDAMGDNSEVYPSGLPWFMRVQKSTAYHIHVDGSAISYPSSSPDERFENPIVAFGTGAGNLPLYTNQTYSFGLHAGNGATSLLRITWYTRGSLDVKQTNVVPSGSVEIALPQKGTPGWEGFAQDGYIVRDTSAPGLQTTIRFVDGATEKDKWGVALTTPLLLSHLCTDPNYYYRVDFKGKTWLPNESPDTAEGHWMAVTDPGNPGDGTAAYSLGYTMDFDVLPAWRSTYVTQPEFAGGPVPPIYYGKSVEELLHAAPLVNKQFTSGPPDSSYLALNTTPELRSHPVLDKFVADMGNDPIAITNYVLNQIELTDALSYNDDGSVDEASINEGGVNRGALATLIEGQGSPAEQCALLVYLLRKAGVPAGYVFPTHDTLSMLDSEMSSLLRMQLRNLQEPDGSSYVPHVLPVNYPWVAAYIASENRWVHIFPWIKDTSIQEGFNLYDYLPSGYQSGYEWLKKYLENDSTLLAYGHGKDTVGAIFQPYVEDMLRAHHPDISIDDIGTIAYNRQNNYLNWNDFPRPWSVDETKGPARLYSTLAAVDPNIFDTVSFTVYNDVNSNGVIDTNEPALISTGTLRTLDLHNRRLVVSTGNDVSPGYYPLNLTLASFVAPTPGATVETSDFVDDPNLLKREASTAFLGPTDDALLFQIIYNRHRALSNFTDANGAFLDVHDARQIVDTRPLRKGDLAALCLNFGRVTRTMLGVQANELWANQQYLQQNPTATGNSDIFTGGSAYLMGMSYYEKVARFQLFAEPLHKVNVVSFSAHGFSKISPSRDPVTGQIALDTHGRLQLTKPNVDMSFQRVAWAGNGSVRPDSGLTNNIVGNDFYELLIGQMSSEEHDTIDSFYQQYGSASTVKLLHLAQTGPPGLIVEMDKGSYVAQGDVLYSGKSLKVWGGFSQTNPTAPCMWKTISDGFTTDWTGDYQQVFMTPGPITASSTSGSYKGVGALILNPAGHAALITPDLNGGFANFDLNSGFYQQENYGSIMLGTTASSDGNADYYVSSTVNYTATSPLVYTGVTPLIGVGQQVTMLDSGTGIVGNYTSVVLGNGMSILGRSSASVGVQLETLADVGTLNIGATDSSGTIQQTSTSDKSALEWVWDPVSPMTGEFYHDEIDLRLNGPMPIEVRRNYSSQNLADGEFGYGWKMSFVPYLVPSQEGNEALIYAAEMDGSVFAYRRQQSGSGGWLNTWIPTIADNPCMSNRTNEKVGSTVNPFNAKLTSAVDGSGTTNYSLTGADGSVRVYKMRSYPIGGVNRQRPYLASWTDNKGLPGTNGNNYTFRFYGDDAGEDNTTVGYGGLKRVIASNGNFVGFNYDAYGHVIEAFSGDGRRVIYVYDDQGDLTAVVRPDESRVRYEYQYGTQTTNGVASQYSQHLIQREIKPEGRVVSNTYDDGVNGRRVTTQSSSIGLNNQIVTNATFTYFTTVDPVDKTISGYTEVRDAYTNMSRYDFNKSKLTKTTDPLNHSVSLEWYNAADNSPGAYPAAVKTQTDARGLVTNYAYDSLGNVLTVTKNGDLTGSGGLDTATTQYTYTPQNLIHTITYPGPIGNVVTNQYGDPSHPYLLTTVTKTNPAGGYITSTSWTYQNVVQGGNSAYGLIQSTTVGPGTSSPATVNFVNDARGFVDSISKPTGTSDPTVTKTFTRNLRGEVVTETDSAGRTSAYTYDAMGHRASSERRDGSGNLVWWEYDYYTSNGELEWVDGPRYDPEDYILHHYDGGGRPKDEIHWRTEAAADASGVEPVPGVDNALATTSYFHDLYGNLSEVIDANHNAATMTYDSVGQMLSRSYHDGDDSAPVVAQQGWTYEPGGQIESYTNELGGTTRKFYTSDGQLKRQENPDNSIEEWRYQLDGRVVQDEVNGATYTVTSYDDANRTVSYNTYSSSGTPLRSNVIVSDYRGNQIQRTDSEGNSFSSTYDALNRLTTTTGPTTSPSSAQQVSSMTYDAAGVVESSTNGLSERTTTTSDVLDRPISTQVFDASGTLIRTTGYSYAADGHSYVKTQGSGANAIVDTIFTDTNGKTVLVKHADGTFYLTGYDNLGNAIVTDDESCALTYYYYDSLGRLSDQILSGGATTHYDHDAAGNVLEVDLPSGQKQITTFDNAGRKQTDELDGTQNTGAGGSISGACRQLYYYYYTTGPSTGKLSSVIDGRGVTISTDYDQLGRPQVLWSSGPENGQNQETVYTYDKLSHIKSIAQSYLVANIGSSTLVERDYDGYGGVSHERISIDGNVTSEFNQTWNKAGRRTALSSLLAAQGSGAGRALAFGYRADGLMTSANAGGTTFSYSYDNSGLLINRGGSGRVQNVGSRDSRGRILTESTTVGGTVPLSETQSWFARGQRSNYSSNRTGVGTWNDSRNYSYNSRGQLFFESNIPIAGGSGNFQYRFDFEPLSVGPPGAGLGVRTSAIWRLGSDASTVQVGSELTDSEQFFSEDARGVDAFSRPTTEYEVPGSANTLNESDSVYDEVGNVEWRSYWTNGSTPVERLQQLGWDSFGRLGYVQDGPSADWNNGYVWQATYDGFGRRLRTVVHTLVNGVASGSQTQIDSQFDPQVEFLEVSVALNGGSRSWELHGPDVSGLFGALQGIGGLEATIDESSGTVTSVVNDAFGDVVGRVVGGVFQWNPAQLGSYGVLPGYDAPQLDGSHSAAESLVWRSRRIDITGLYCMGARYYDPSSGRFLSADPRGHTGSLSLYDYSNGDPVNGLDPDGRYGKNSYYSAKEEMGVQLGTFTQFKLDDAKMGAAVWTDGVTFGQIPSIHAQANAIIGSNPEFEYSLGFGNISGGAMAVAIAPIAIETATTVAGSSVAVTQTALATGSLGYALSTQSGQYLVQTGGVAVDAAASWAAGSPFSLTGNAYGGLFSSEGSFPQIAGSESTIAADSSSFLGGCFPAEEVVSTENGLEHIKDIKVGELIWSFNLHYVKWELKPAEALIVHKYNGDIITCDLGVAKMTASGNHPVWVTQGKDLASRPAAADVPAKEREGISKGRWVEARSLRPGDLLLSRGGQLVPIRSLSTRVESLLVYNIRVKDNHTYAVSKARVLVHNKAAQITAVPQASITMDEAVELATQHVGPVNVVVTSGSGGVQAMSTAVDANGNTITSIARVDINPASTHVQKLGPHLNLETQFNGVTVVTGPLADPHIPIDPSTIKPTDY